MEGIKCKDCYWCTGIPGVIPFTCERYPECDPCDPEAEACDLFEPEDFK